LPNWYVPRTVRRENKAVKSLRDIFQRYRSVCSEIEGDDSSS
jgi:hypothetical protein